MERFIKGFISGLGAVSPGLSGSVLMVIFGIYIPTVESISNFFKEPQKSIEYLFPILGGIGLGVLVFSKLVNYFLIGYEMYTRYFFLGLVLGTVPLFLKEIKEEKLTEVNYLLILTSFLLGLALMFWGKELAPSITNFNFYKSILLGILIAASTIIPGIDSAVLLSALGLYNIYIAATSSLNFTILLPAIIGVGIGTIVFSFIMNHFLKKYKHNTFSVLFGLFVSIIPSVLNSPNTLSGNIYISYLLTLIGILFSYNFSKLEEKLSKNK